MILIMINKSCIVIELGKNLYDFCKENAKASVTSYSKEKISEKWLDLINKNIK